jgi:hypothetical protein
MAADMVLECSEENSDRISRDQQQQQQPPSSQRGRMPPIIPTSAINFIQLQKQLKGFMKRSFEFRNTRNGTTVVTKGMADFLTLKENFNLQNLNYFTFFPTSLKPMKAVIRHLPGNTPVEEIYEGLVQLGFYIKIVKQMSTIRRSKGSALTNLPLFLITFLKSEKSHEIFKLTNLCYITIKVEPYRSQTGLTQCHNCQQFGHV